YQAVSIGFVTPEPDDGASSFVPAIYEDDSLTLADEISTGTSSISGRINTGTFTGTINGPITGSGHLYKAGSGTLIATKITGGTLTIESGGGTVVFTNGGGTTHLDGIELAAASGVPIVALSMGDNSMVVGGGTSKSTITSWIANGRNGGSWNGTGITS